MRKFFYSSTVIPFRFFFQNKTKKPSDIIADPLTVYNYPSNEFETESIIHSDSLVILFKTNSATQEVFEILYKKDKDNSSIFRTLHRDVGNEIFQTVKHAINFIFISYIYIRLSFIF